MTETPDGPRGHPDPLAELEARAQEQVNAYARSLAEAETDLNVIQAMRLGASLEEAERRRRIAAARATMRRLGWRGIVGAVLTFTGLGALLKLLAAKPPAAAAVTALALGATGAVIWLLPPLFEHGPERDNPPRPAPTAPAPTGPNESSPSPAPTTPSPSETPTTSPTPSPSPSTTEPEGGNPAITPEPEPEPTSPPPAADGTPSPEPPGEEPPPAEPAAEPAQDCLIRLDLPPLADLCLL